MESLTTAVPEQMTEVSNPTLGVSMMVPPFTAKAQDGTDFTGQLSISEVPTAMVLIILQMPNRLPPIFQK